MKHQSISPTRPRKASDLAAKAAEALGGPPVKPPALPTRKITRPNVAAETEAGREAKEAFTLATGGTIGPATAATLGNTTFDGVPDEMRLRREKVAAARAGLAKLATSVLKAHEMITPILDDLGDDAEGLKQGEAFDCEVARGFLNGLKTVVDGIAARGVETEPATPAEEETPTE